MSVTRTQRTSMRRPVALALALALAASVPATTREARAQSAAPANSAAPAQTPSATPSAAPARPSIDAAFVGTWRLSTAGAEGIIHAAIDRAIAGMGFIAEPIARGRLRDRTRPHAWARIETFGDELAVTLEGRTPVRAPPDGSPRRGSTPQGEPYTVTTRLESSRIVQEFRLEQGGRRHVFALQPDGSLELRVRIFSDRLPRAVEYALTFRR